MWSFAVRREDLYVGRGQPPEERWDEGICETCDYGCNSASGNRSCQYVECCGCRCVGDACDDSICMPNGPIGQEMETRNEIGQEWCVG